MATGKRLIDANELLKDAENYSPFGAGLADIYDVQWIVGTQPTVDAVEVVYSRWKYYRKQNTAVCMNCSFERDLDTNFGRAISCPNCGAMMNGGADNGL